MKLAPVLRTARAEIGLAFRHLETGEAWTHNDRRFPAGDLVRLPLALAAYDAVARGKLHLSATVKVEGGGLPQAAPRVAGTSQARVAPGIRPVRGPAPVPEEPDREGTSFTVRDLLRLTLDGRNPSAPAILASLLDLRRANESLSAWGLAMTVLAHPPGEGGLPVTTPGEMALLLGILLDGDALPAIHRHEALSFMRLPEVPTPLRKLALPGDPAHLEARDQGFRHLVYVKGGKGGYLFAILAEGRVGAAALSRIVSTVDEHYAGIHENYGRVVAMLESQRSLLAPDSRTAVWDVRAFWREGKVHLAGRVSSPGWPGVVEACRQVSDVPVIDAVKRLGATPPWAIALAPVVHLRKEPSHASELVSQVAMGSLLEVLESGEDWWLVRAPDGLLAWARSTNLQPATDRDAERWQGRDQVLVTAPLVTVRRLTHGTVILGAGTRLAFMGRRKDGLLGRTPGREEVLVPAEACRYLPGGRIAESSDAADLIRLALPFLGVPYVWGGTSGWGLDCSGLTQVVFQMAGIKLPRDSDQQFAMARGIQAVDHVKDLAPGDLVFFNGHVGIALERGEFIHASAPAGCVTINALVPGAPHFASSLLKRFLGGARVLGAGLDLGPPETPRRPDTAEARPATGKSS